jgi:hypothetical protein
MPQEWIFLKREDFRLRTFNEHFSATFLSPLLLAKAGFFYAGIDDQVQCAFCRGVVRDWEINDDPKREHQRLFPSCAFILGWFILICNENLSLICVLFVRFTSR